MTSVTTIKKSSRGTGTLIVFVIVANLAQPVLSESELKDQYQKEIVGVPVHRLEEASQLRIEKDYSTAIRMLKELEEQYPNYYLAHYNLGLAYAAQGLPDAAVEELEHALAIRERERIPEYTIYNALGWFYLVEKRYVLAEKNLLIALQHKEDLPENSIRRVYNNLGLLYYYLQDVESARKYLNIATQQYDSGTARETLELVDKLEATQKVFDISRYIQVAIAEGEYIGKKIWLNETGGEEEFLTYWPDGDNHASVGIGHFIWYPAGAEKRFEETFPKLLDHLEVSGIELPVWLPASRACPWQTSEEFNAAQNTREMKELRALMTRTVSKQVQFMVTRLRNALPIIVRSIPSNKHDHVRTQFDRVLRGRDGSISTQGVYAMLDYVNFKGEGVKSSERYNDNGWGLLQVLEEMSGIELGAVDEFADAAEKVLIRRIENAPPDRQEKEKSYLKGWNIRLDSYRTTPG